MKVVFALKSSRNGMWYIKPQFSLAHVTKSDDSSMILFAFPQIEHKIDISHEALDIEFSISVRYIFKSDGFVSNEILFVSKYLENFFKRFGPRILKLWCQRLNNLIVPEVEKGTEKDLKMDKKLIFYQSFDRRIAMDFHKNVKKGENSLSQDELETLKTLSRNKNLVIAKADKWNEVVFQDKQEYIKKMVEILID